MFQALYFSRVSTFNHYFNKKRLNNNNNFFGLELLITVLTIHFHEIPFVGPKENLQSFSRCLRLSWAFFGPNITTPLEIATYKYSLNACNFNIDWARPFLFVDQKP